MRQQQENQNVLRQTGAANSGVFTKPATPPQAALHRAAHTLSLTSGLFEVPRIVAEDPQAGTMTMEYLPDLLSLKDRLGQGLDTAALLSRIGCSLGVLHRRLTLPPEQSVAAPQPWLGEASERVCVHGDFNMTNLCYDPRRERLVILDWETSPALPFVCTQASRYLDIAQFVRSLLLQQRSLLIGGLLFIARVHYFLTGYEQGAGVRLDAARLKKYVRAYNRNVLKKQWSAGKYRSWLQSEAGGVVIKVLPVTLLV